MFQVMKVLREIGETKLLIKMKRLTGTIAEQCAGVQSHMFSNCDIMRCVWSPAVAIIYKVTVELLEGSR